MSKNERNMRIPGLRPNLSNGNIIIDNYIFWSEIGSGFEEPGGTPPPRIPKNSLSFPFHSTVGLNTGSPNAVLANRKISCYLLFTCVS